MITDYFSEHFTSKLPCSVFVYKVLANILPLGAANWENANYRAIQIETVTKPFSGIDLVSSLNKGAVWDNINKIPENTWTYCQHWNMNYKSGHAYFYLRNGNMHIIVDSSEVKYAGVRVSFGKAPNTSTYFKAVKVG